VELELTSGLILLLATIPVALGLSWYAWSCRSLPGAVPFAAMIPLAALWATAGVFEFAVTELGSKLFWANIQYISITLLPVALLALAASYTRHRAWLSWRRLLALYVVPLITQLLLWTDGYHHLMRATVWLEMAGSHPLVGRTFGPWFWIHCAYSYTLAAIAMVMLVGAIRSAPPFYRRQPVAILVGFFIPFAYNAVFIFDPENMPPFDFTPAALALAGVIIAWGLFRIRVFNLVPAARHNSGREYVRWRAGAGSI
jgi:hypothetical protein